MLEPLDKLVQSLVQIAAGAGKEILAVYQQSSVTSILKSDASPLTEADLRSHHAILHALAKICPGVPVLSEESDSTVLSSSEFFFLVDPLDGTKEFIKRTGEFTVNIALIKHGEPVPGVVHLPVQQKSYFASKGNGAFLQDMSGVFSLRVSGGAMTNQVLRVVGSRSHGNDRLLQMLAEVDQPYELNELGSSLKFCMIAEGLADLYPRLGPTSQWDTAAAQCVLEEAGGVVLACTGQRLLYGLDKPILNPEFFAAAKSVDAKACLKLYEKLFAPC